MGSGAGRRSARGSGELAEEEALALPGSPPGGSCPAGEAELPPAREGGPPDSMGTPASVAACELPQCQAPESRSRKKASGNIFQGVGLLELWRLFRSSGDAWAEERARLVWECAGEQRVAQALGQLHRRQRRRPRQRRDQPQQRGPAMDPDSDIGQLGLQHFSSLRIEDRSSPLCGDAGGSSKLEVPGRARQRKGGPGPLGYLRGVRR